MAREARCPPERLALGWLTVFVVGTDLFAVSPLLPLIAADYRISPAVCGLSMSAFALSYVIAAPLFGHAADKFGRERILCRCLAGFAAANAATGVAPNLWWMLFARLLAGAAAAGVSPSVYALVGAAAPPAQRATWLSFVVSGLLLSLTWGAPIALLAANAFGWPSAFFGLALASLALSLANRTGWPAAHAAVPVAASSARPQAGIITARLAPMAAWSTALYGMYTYLGTGLAAVGFSAGEIARTVACYGAGAIAGLLLGGRLADRLGTKTTCGISLAALFCSLLLLRLAIASGGFADAALFLTSAAAQLFFPAQQAGLVNDFPERRATVLAWNNSILFLGILIGSLLGGQAMAHGGFVAAVTLSAVVALAGWAVNRIVVPNGARRHPPAGRFGFTWRRAARNATRRPRPPLQPPVPPGG